jgi:acyl-CoA hydrolase
MNDEASPAVCHERTVLVRPQYLNHAGTLFGGYMMQWADDLAYCAASLAYPEGNFVTRLFGEFNFNSPVRQGDIIKIYSRVESRGNTSFKVQVWAVSTQSRKEVFRTFAVLVNVVEGKKAPIPSHIGAGIFPATPGGVIA